jgi:alpha-tubulin suppressor-like RCC1 family protein
MGIIGLGLLAVIPLASCGGSGGPRTDTPTLTLWQLPPEFTRTVSPTMTLTATPLVSATPTSPVLQQTSSVPIAAGWNHVCAVTGEGGVMCWGNNENGQLGDGSRTDRTKPTEVKGLNAKVVALTAGLGHTCALTADGGVKCWGRNKSGQLGNGSDQRTSDVVDVAGLGSGVVAIAAGDDHTCALTAQGAVLCWGFNNFGQLGDGTYDFRTAPIAIDRLSSGTSGIAAGSGHTCAVNGGGVLCWGNNDMGQLGDGSDTPSRAAPGAVSGLSGGIAALTGKGSHTCVLTASGAVQCWGYNKFGQLGDGTADNRSTPVALTGVDGAISALVAGWNHTCSLTTGGVLKCWGWNFYGQLGDGSTANRRQPIDVTGLSGKPVAITGGGGHTCAVLEDGSVSCWGWNERGQLGNRSNQDSVVPVKIIGITVPAGH